MTGYCGHMSRLEGPAEVRRAHGLYRRWVRHTVEHTEHCTVTTWVYVCGDVLHVSKVVTDHRPLQNISINMEVVL